MYGGLRFFERAEIKDALAYLRLIFNRADDASFERVVNLPARGIGTKTLDTVRNYARANACSMWQAAGACIAELGDATRPEPACVPAADRAARSADAQLCRCTSRSITSSMRAA